MSREAVKHLCWCGLLIYVMFK